MKCALASFAKTPGLSPVKTRLAAEIGTPLAETFYCMCVDAVEEVLLRVRSESNSIITPYWALAEKNSSGHSMWNNLPTIWTGDGGLGDRLFNVSRKMLKQYDCVIITGTDSPQLEPRIYHMAYSMLNDYPDQCVIGPSLDGGFYLFGSSFQVPEYIWTDVEYSREDTLEHLLFGLKGAGFKYSLLEVAADADTFDDFKTIAESLMRNNDKNLPAQKRLNTWLGEFYQL